VEINICLHRALLTGESLSFFSVILPGSGERFCNFFYNS
jgi:hypothetical protein